MRVRLIFTLMVIPLLTFSQERVRFKYFENTEKFKSGDFRGLVKGVEFYDSTGRMISEYDFTKIEPLDRIYKLGLESNWENGIHYSSEDCNLKSRFSKKDSLFWSPFVNVSFNSLKPCSVKINYPTINYTSDSLCFLFYEPTFFFGAEGGTTFNPTIFQIHSKRGIQKLKVDFPTRFTFYNFSDDGNYFYGFQGDEMEQVDGLTLPPSIYLFETKTGKAIFKLPTTYKVYFKNDGYSNFYLIDFDKFYYFMPNQRRYLHFDNNQIEITGFEFKKGILRLITSGNEVYKEMDIFKNNNWKLFNK